MTPGRAAVRVGVFGGTFDPIHTGHLAIATEVCAALDLDRVLFVPAGEPPHRDRPVLDGRHRLELIRRAIAHEPRFEVSDIEIRRRGRSYTVETLESLTRTRPESEFYLIFGLDAFLAFESWRRPERIMALAHLVVVSRPGSQFVQLAGHALLADVAPEALAALDAGRDARLERRLPTGRRLVLLRVTPHAISATEIRAYLAGRERARNILPASVESYIIQNELYKSTDPN